MAKRKKDTFTPFKKGQKVWLDMRNMKTNYHKKMAPKREGPFEITKVLGPVTYQLHLPETWKVHNVFHAILLKPYKENDTHGKNFTLPPPDIVDGQEMYEIESIVKHRRRGRGYQYLVKWKGYPIEEASWEPESSFGEDRELLHAYQTRNQL